MPKDTPQFDHKAKALRCLRDASKLLLRKYGKPTAGEMQHAALVHSNLAIAEGQERVAEEIKELRGEVQVRGGLEANPYLQEIDGSDYEPPAGEAERLRELEAAVTEIDKLGEWFFTRTEQTDLTIDEFARKWGQLSYHELIKGPRMDGIYRGRVSRFDPETGRTSTHAETEPAPRSDSQGDQERCGGSKLLSPKRGEGTTAFRKCPDCPDCNPAPTQGEVEGDVADANGVSEIDRAIVEDLAEQVEGGDEEDWPPQLLVEELAGRYHGRMPLDESFKDEEVESRSKFADAEKLAREDLIAIGRYLPASSQDSSGLEEKVKRLTFERASIDASLGTCHDELNVERDRASKAEAERDDLRIRYGECFEKLQRSGDSILDLAAKEVREKAAKLKEGQARG